MSLLISVPIHGFGQNAFWFSMMALQEVLVHSTFKHEFQFIEGESLVQRARNNAVRRFLETDYERMLFIDSDIEFDAEDVQKLWNLDEDVCCASYPMKKIGIPSACWKDGKLVDLDSLDGPTEIDLAATGFLMVKRKVFTNIRRTYPERLHMEGRADDMPTLAKELSKRHESFSWFDPRVENDTYLSEDYAFSKDFRNIGGKIMLDPSIRLKHYGTFGFGE